MQIINGMRFFQKNKIHFIVFIFFITSSFFLYQKVLEVFFQQDEWYLIGQTKVDGIFAIVKYYSFFELLVGNIRVLGTIWANMYHLLWPLQSMPFAITSIILHGCVVWLVFIIGRKIGLSLVFSFGASVIVLVSSVSSQAVIWFASTVTTLPNAIFGLISIFFFLEAREKNSIRRLLVSMVLLYVSLLFKESTIMLLPVYILLLFFSSVRGKRSGIILCIFFVVVLAVLRLGLLMNVPSSSSFVTAQGNRTFSLVLRILLYPFLALTQQYIPFDINQRISGSIVKMFYPFVLSHDYKTALTSILVADVTSLVVSCLVLVYFIIIVGRVKKSYSVLLSIVIVNLLLYVPFAIVTRPQSSYLESRYYYLGIIAGAYLCMYSIQLLPLPKRVVIIFAAFFLSVYGIIHVKRVRGELLTQALTARTRTELIDQIQKIGTKIPDKPVILLVGDAPGMYGIGNLSIPFQQGMGYTIATVWYKHGVIPDTIIRDGMLWNINEEGYFESGKKGFGFYTSEISLLEGMRQYHFAPETVVYLEYYHKDNTLVRKELPVNWLKGKNGYTQR